MKVFLKGREGKTSDRGVDEFIVRADGDEVAERVIGLNDLEDIDETMGHSHGHNLHLLYSPSDHPLTLLSLIYNIPETWATEKEVGRPYFSMD